MTLTHQLQLIRSSKSVAKSEREAAKTFVLKHLGKPYSHNGYGPDTFFCWGFVWLLQKELFNRDFPRIEIGDEKISTYIRTLSLHRDEFESKLKRIDKPVHGCFVEMSHANHPHHVGVWLELNGGGVAHCSEQAGVSFDKLISLHGAGWRRMIYSDPR